MPILTPVYSAHDVALSKQHKSISASDVFKALEVLELGDMTDALQAELQSTSPSLSNVVKSQ